MVWWLTISTAAASSGCATWPESIDFREDTAWPTVRAIDIEQLTRSSQPRPYDRCGYKLHLEAPDHMIVALLSHDVVMRPSTSGLAWLRWL